MHDLVYGPVVMEHLGELLRSPLVSLDNLRLDDVPLMIQELSRFAGVGGGAVVELTSNGLKRNPLGLCAISRATGVHVVMGAGYYVAAAHPPELADRSVDDLADEMVREIRDGVGDTGVRPGIIGEIGTGNPMLPAEARVVRAAARAAGETGLALNIHVGMGPAPPRSTWRWPRGCRRSASRSATSTP
jgi:phosphotriesterase-related protein